MVKDTMKYIKSTIGKINVKYDMSARQLLDIENNSSDRYDLITNGFRLGYVQGMKAAKAEMREKGILN